MTAAVVTLAAALAGAMSLLAWLTYQTISARTATAEEREDHVATRGDLERVRFELEVAKSRLADSEQLNAALQEVLADVDANPNRDLDPADVRSRVLRAAAQAARDRAGAVPAAAGAPVPAGAAADSAGAAGVRAEHDPDGLMSPDAT